METALTVAAHGYMASTRAMANNYLNRTVTSVGTQNGVGAYARFAERTSAKGAYGVVYLGGRPGDLPRHDRRFAKTTGSTDYRDVPLGLVRPLKGSWCGGYALFS